jgi:hypothetical protein
MLGNVNTSSALSAFEKMEEKGTLFMSDFSHQINFFCFLNYHAPVFSVSVTH